jgi:hypothetical protein
VMIPVNGQEVTNDEDDQHRFGRRSSADSIRIA